MFSFLRYDEFFSLKGSTYFFSCYSKKFNILSYNIFASYQRLMRVVDKSSWSMDRKTMLVEDKSLNLFLALGWCCGRYCRSG